MDQVIKLLIVRSIWTKFDAEIRNFRYHLMHTKTINQLIESAAVLTIKYWKQLTTQYITLFTHNFSVSLCYISTIHSSSIPSNDHYFIYMCCFDNLSVCYEYAAMQFDTLSLAYSGKGRSVIEDDCEKRQSALQLFKCYDWKWNGFFPPETCSMCDTFNCYAHSIQTYWQTSFQ